MDLYSHSYSYEGTILAVKLHVFPDTAIGLIIAAGLCEVKTKNTN